MTAAAGLVDFHCHLDLYPDHEAAVLEADQAGVFTLAVTTTPRAWPRNHELAQRTRHVRAALGLHPQLVAERASELDLWDRHLSETRYVGEVGLDAGPRFYKSFDLQKQVFQHVLQRCAESGDKVVTVHSIRAAKIVLDHIERFLPATRGKVVLHWFTGTKAEATRALALGCYFSINAAMLENQRHSAMVAAIPVDRLLTETDGPFTKTGARPSKPADVAAVIDLLSGLHNIPPATMAATVRGNLRCLLAYGESTGLKGP
jgi:TatD DNase family protein